MRNIRSKGCRQLRNSSPNNDRVQACATPFLNEGCLDG